MDKTTGTGKNPINTRPQQKSNSTPRSHTLQKRV